jgi:hypothetical protein
MLILSFAVRSLSDLANLPITFWSSSQIAHDTRTVRAHTLAGQNFHLERATSSILVEPTI